MTSIPATMTAIGITSAGGPETLLPQERPVPQPGDEHPRRAEDAARLARAGRYSSVFGLFFLRTTTTS